MIYTFPNFISKEECKTWISKAPKSKEYDQYSFDNRVSDINGTSDDKIIYRVLKYLRDVLHVKTECYHAQIQVWPKGGGSGLHIHDDDGRNHGDYNSLLYLNNNFWGGEFITKTEIIKPKPGLLTFFDGSKIHHGVKNVRFNHRYTLIFWWKNTIFMGD